MALAADVLVGLIAFIHVYFLVLEMFLFSTPFGQKTFGVKAELATNRKVKALAANQGLYNGFLAAGLVWGLWLGQAAHAFEVKVFFLACVLVAGIYGGLTALRTILFVQALPAAIALGLMFAGR